MLDLLRGSLLSGTVADRPAGGIEAARLVELLSKLPEDEQKKAIGRINQSYKTGYAAGRHAAAGLSPGEQLAESIKMAARQAAGSDEAKRAFAIVLNSFESRKSEIESELSTIRDERIWLRRGRDALEDLISWAEREWQLERPNGSVGQRLVASFRKGNIIILSDHTKRVEGKFAHALDEHHQSFLIEHDWAAAFKNAVDFAEGEYRLPFECCIFEARLGGKRLCAAVTQMDDRLNCLLFIDTRAGWALFGAFDLLPPYVDWKSTEFAVGESEKPLSLMTFMGKQIRAISIALESEIVETQAVREPYVGKPNEAGALPQFSYHVVSLSRRVRAAGLRGSDQEPQRHLRMHFVRGHWRHYPSHKTWIKWYLRGDPDLGFVDKHYRL